MKSSKASRSRFRGALLGLACGDALGTTVEFTPPGSFAPVDDIVGGGPFGLRAGEWTGDTSMALCLAASLAEQGGFDAIDQMRRYLQWRDEGYMSSNGRCFDIGNTVSAALSRFEQTGKPFAGSDDPRSAGNGSLMRLAPVALFFAADPERAIRCCADSSRTTHGARTAVDACRYFGGMIVGALAGKPREELLRPRYSPVPGLWNGSLSPQRSTRSLPDPSSSGSRRKSSGAGTSSVRSRRRSGRSAVATTSGLGRCSPSISATMRTQPVGSTVNLGALSTAKKGFRQSGEQGLPAGR